MADDLDWLPNKLRRLTVQGGERSEAFTLCKERAARVNSLLVQSSTQLSEHQLHEQERVYHCARRAPRMASLVANFKLDLHTCMDEFFESVSASLDEDAAAGCKASLVRQPRDVSMAFLGPVVAPAPGEAADVAGVRKRKLPDGGPDCGPPLAVQRGNRTDVVSHFTIARRRLRDTRSGVEEASALWLGRLCMS